MANIGKETQQKSTIENTVCGPRASSWSRQQKFAMIGSFAVLAVFLAVVGCSTQSAKEAPTVVPSPALSLVQPPIVPMAQPTPSATALPAPLKKVAKKRPANVIYKDADSGVSFLYPRKAVLISHDDAKKDSAAADDVKMNFVHDGGVAVATVVLPEKSYPGTDFESGFFQVNVNRGLSQQECAQFAVVDNRDADAEPVDAEKVSVGPAAMEMTSISITNSTRQTETQYYHNFVEGACYEYVLGLETEGFSTEGGVKHVKPEAVFAKLEKILATVKIKSQPAEQESVKEAAVSEVAGGKE